jgi:hypothetical protein
MLEDSDKIKSDSVKKGAEKKAEKTFRIDKTIDKDGTERVRVIMLDK